MSVPVSQVALNTPPLDRRRVYILPSRYGVILGLLLFAILLGSINYDNALGYMLTFLIAGLYLVAMLHTYRNLVGMKLNDISTDDGFVGDLITFHLNLTNTHGLDKYNLSLDVQSEPAGWLKRRQPITQSHVPKVAGHHAQNCTLALKATRRGRLALPRIKISSTFPLGIFVAWGYLPSNTSSLVFPKPEGRLSLPPANTSSDDGTAGDGHGDADFYGLREYSGGEPIKRIAWRALAKYDELLVKQFSGNNELFLVLEWRATASLGDTERRLSQLCAWVLQADQLGVPFGLVLPNDNVPVSSGEAHRLRCLRTLAEH